jgi:transcriptional regulator with XRE-family HTH domain
LYKVQRMEKSPRLIALGKAIQIRRVKLGLSREQLAEESGLHLNYIGSVERGERNLGFENLARIADALRMTTSELMSEVESLL